MANGTDPFTPRTSLSRIMLERYAQGGLDPEERHAVELHLERDPLLHEASEGLAMPGAVAAFHDLAASRMPGIYKWPLRLLWSSIAITGAALFVAEFQAEKPKSPLAPVVARPSFIPEKAVSLIAMDSTLDVVHAEIHACPAPTPEPLAGPIAQERFTQHATSSEATKREHIERISGQPMKVEPPPAISTVPMKHARGVSRRLVFLHGLKLVHPDELYGKDAPLIGSLGIPANVDPDHKDTTPSPPSTRPYLSYMDEALGAYVNGDARVALDDLYFLLAQYPDDVNAQFYAGLACYDIGLYPRAERLFAEAEANAVDTFDEEAQWYHALTLERMQGASAAKPAFERIARADGFYAEQAAKRIR